MKHENWKEKRKKTLIGHALSQLDIRNVKHNFIYGHHIISMSSGNCLLHRAQKTNQKTAHRTYMIRRRRQKKNATGRVGQKEKKGIGC